MLYKNLFQLYPDNFQNNYFLLSDKLEDIRYIEEFHCMHVFPIKSIQVKLNEMKEAKSEAISVGRV